MLFVKAVGIFGLRHHAALGILVPYQVSRLRAGGSGGAFISLPLLFYGSIMLRLAFRFAGFLAVAAAFTSLIIDGTRSIAGNAVSLTLLGQTASAFFPAQFPALGPAIERNIHPLLWNPVLTTLFRLPTWLVIGLFGLLLLALTRKPPPKIGYSNR